MNGGSCCCKDDKYEIGQCKIEFGHTLDRSHGHSGMSLERPQFAGMRKKHVRGLGDIQVEITRHCFDD
jgi:hypothetical protein